MAAASSQTTSPSSWRNQTSTGPSSGGHPWIHEVSRTLSPGPDDRLQAAGCSLQAASAPGWRQSPEQPSWRPPKPDTAGSLQAVACGLGPSVPVNRSTPLYRSSNTIRLFAFALALALGMLPPHAVLAGGAEPQPPKGFTALFNGRDLSGFHGLEHFDPRKLRAMTAEERAAKRKANDETFRKHWRVENGELVNDGDGPYATTDREYGDIELLIEYRTVAKADSGIHLRGNPQVQIWDYTREGGKGDRGAEKGSGGLWNNRAGSPGKHPLVLADKPFGQWNALRIRQVGDKTMVHLNDKLVVDHATMENYWDPKESLWARGPIQLQTHGGEIRWRNIFIREIPADEATRILSERDDASFASIFNGRDFTGWTGPLDHYEI